jgi:proteasome lid subunit RPN8/RPN11
MAAGDAGTDRPTRVIPMRNVEASPTSFSFDALQQFQVWREMDERDEVPVVIYSSREEGQAYPSSIDIRLAADLYAHYVYVSVSNVDNVEFRSFLIADGKATEERVQFEDPAR